MPTTKIHLGYNVKRIREALGIKQSSFAYQMNISQQAISLLEKQAHLNEEFLIKAAEVLKVPVQSIKSFNDNKLFDILCELSEKKD